MADSRMKGRVKGLLAGAPPDNVPVAQTHELLDPDAQHQALQVLVLAQRTADEHVAAAQRQADNIRTDARTTAEQVARDAQAHADGARREAGTTLSDARTTAEQIVRDAQAHGDGVRSDAEKILSEAQAAGAEIVKNAQANAAGLEREAQQRYDGVVGSLAAKRAALQQQIDALQQFDRDYRSRLRTFMQRQLHALGVDEPVTTADIQQPGQIATTEAQPAPQ